MIASYPIILLAIILISILIDNYRQFLYIARTTWRGAPSFSCAAAWPCAASSAASCRAAAWRSWRFGGNAAGKRWGKPWENRGKSRGATHCRVFVVQNSGTTMRLNGFFPKIQENPRGNMGFNIMKPLKMIFTQKMGIRKVSFDK